MMVVQETELCENHVRELVHRQTYLRRENDRLSAAVDTSTRVNKQILDELAPYLRFFANVNQESLANLVLVDTLTTSTKISFGITITVLKELRFKEIDVPFFHTAPWLIRSLPLIRRYIANQIKLKFLRDEQRIIRDHEILITKQLNGLIHNVQPRLRDEQRRSQLARHVVSMATLRRLALMERIS